jgi:hypothetical protein
MYLEPGILHNHTHPLNTVPYSGEIKKKTLKRSFQTTEKGNRANGQRFLYDKLQTILQ